MDQLMEGIGLRGFAQKDPLVEYKKESYVLFQDMMDRMEDETVRYLFFLQVQREEDRGLSAKPLADEELEGMHEPEPEPVGTAHQRAAAQTSLQDFTRK